ncbi:MAG: acetyl-CoA carboxylase biotin carboxyl carrier protein subunit [Sulfuritalea sp.]|nr:acetyl-CoA carboxylase biotin carboxyl carrier protein subunit [Sulfuritalea sp.]MBK8121566.1 acetyl-CoA carboxylase biotin carboxyl carrier protein subunit [Sulfuritalea sp.]
MAVDVNAPMSGRISEILCKVGDQVKFEDELMILEALKMENPIFAPADGKISEIKVAPGAMVESNQLLLVIE